MSEPVNEIAKGICSYCQRKLEMQDEHVVPKSIFVNNNHASIVVPACNDCNRRKGRGEGDLRDWMIIRVGVDGHPDIEPLMHEMAASYGMGSSKLRRRQTKSAR